MRYLESEKIIFEDKSGKRFEMLDLQDIPETTGTLMSLTVHKDLDFLSNNIYGHELFWYKIFDANAAEIIENNYDLSNIQSLVIPE